MNHSKKNQGSTLIETVLAMGVLAVAIPLVFGVIAESSKGSSSAEAETLSNWIVPQCMDQIQASRDGKSAYFPTTLAQEAFSLDHEIWALGFSAEGKIINKITGRDYEKGIIKLDEQSIRYIASLSSTSIEEDTAAVPMLRTIITLEYPAAAPAHKREKLIFHTLIP
jgi:type II secretory pathway pseudopilin PulG